MSDNESFAAMTTPEQVLNAGGVSRRRRNLSNKRRSPSGSRRRPQTPDAPRDGDEDPERPVSPPVKTPRSKSGSRSSSASREYRRRLSASETEGEVIKSSITISPSDQGLVIKSVVPGSEVTETTVVTRVETTDAEDESSPTRVIKETTTVFKETTKVVKEPTKIETEQVKVEKETAKSEKETVKAEKEPVKAEKEPSKVEKGKLEKERKPDDEEKIVKKEVEKTELVKDKSKDKEAEEKVKEKENEKEEGKEKEKEKEKEASAEDTKDVVPAVKKESVWRPFLSDIRKEWRLFKKIHNDQYLKIHQEWNKCFAHMIILMIFCGLGGLMFRFTEGAFESFYKCGVKRVKRDFIDSLWMSSHSMREDDWKSQARRKLMEFEEQLHTAHEAGVHTYSGQRAWTFLNAVVYCITVVTTIGYGDISPSTNTGRAITIVYAIFGIPMFLILLADFGKLFTRGIKFLWAFVRRVYYTGSCRKVRRTGPVQEVMKGVQLVYEFATNRRPSQAECEEGKGEVGIHMDGSIPGTPALSNFEIDDEFNLPISVAIVVLLLYIFVGATIFYIWESWGFFESFYFVFISMSTIGFGDFVPQNPVSMILSIVYLVFGLALTSMCINVVQEKLSASFQQASAKIGATIGLRLAQEEEASITPAPPPEVELPEVHQPTSPNMKKSQST